jgi:uncharacterized hydrophobic protein (TIGR00271 family)
MLKKSLDRMFSFIARGWRNLVGDWEPLVERPMQDSELNSTMQRASLPCLDFYFMLALAVVIATFGLLSNSAPIIIGAMIIAPLMSPIISLSFGIVVVEKQLIGRSIVTLFTGSILVIAIAFLCTELLGLRLAGSEVLGRSFPTLLDLGVAIAAGAAAAFAYTRRSIMNSVAGVAIAVALVPPLAVTGIGLAQGGAASAGVGQTLEQIGLQDGGSDIAAGSLVLFLTNLVGVVVTAGAVFVWQGHGNWKKAALGLCAVATLSLALIHPLGLSLYKLYVKSTTLSLVATLAEERPELFSGRARIRTVSVTDWTETIFVHLEVSSPYDNVQQMQERVDLVQKYLLETLGRPVVLSVDVDSFKRLKFKAETEPAQMRDESRPQSEIDDASEQEPQRTQSTAK